jgi:hypothetical protein
MSSGGERQRWVELAVQRIVVDWSSRAEERRPWGTWVLLWGAIERDEELEVPWPAVPLRAAWFLTGSGFVRREVWSYLRYRAMQRAHLLANAVSVLEVAPYRGRCAAYAAGHHGPRNAYGLRLEPGSDGRAIEHRLWVA